MDPDALSTIDVDLTDVAFGGDAIGRVDGEVVFVPFGLPGERVRAELRAQKPQFATAEIVELLQSSDERVAPPCPYFGTCGGCQWQHARYEAQLAMKRRVVAEQLRRIGGFAGAEDLVRAPIGMVNPWEYRNHVRFTLGRKYGDVGYTYRESRRILRVDHCHIAHPAINSVLEAIQRRCAGLRAHQVTVRYGCNTADLLVNPRLPMVPELETGQAALTEQVLDRTFRISSAAFFQVNTRREERTVPSSIAGDGDTDGLYSISDLLAMAVLRRLECGPDDVVVDAYCGVGTFSALLAPRVGSVIGIDESNAALKDAALNTAGLPNVRFVAGKTEGALAELEEPRLDAVVVDPSRAGCAPQVIQAIVARPPRRLVYVSCDPATLARDLRLLTQGGFRVDGVEPFDMFPQTYHIETVTTLTHPQA